MARQIYKNKEGKRLPGVTTITGSELGWNKGVLIDWANKKGLEGCNTRELVDDLAEIGQIAHNLVLDEVRGTIFDKTQYAPAQIDRALKCLDSYKNWAKGKKIEAILTEAQLISEVYQYGGTPDFYGKVDGVLTLTDYKTGKGIYDEFCVQVCGGYLIALEENGYKVEAVEILNIPRTDGESFQVLTIPIEKWDGWKKIYLNCLENYKLHRQLKGE